MSNKEEMTNKQILAITDKTEMKKALESRYGPAMENVRELLNCIGEDPSREGLLDTPYRVVKSFLEIYGGYDDDPKKILGTMFEEEIGDTDEIVLCRNINFYSTCEHHMIPYMGVCHIGYLPSKKVVGLSKLARLVECFARRLQIQEKMTSQIADTLMEVVQPQGVGVIVQGKHLCMCSRGVKNQTSDMLTSAMRGKFKDQPQTRNEFLQLISI